MSVLIVKYIDLVDVKVAGLVHRRRLKLKLRGGRGVVRRFALFWAVRFLGM